MADYISILDKAVSALGENTPENRSTIYEKARAAIERKLRAMDPVPPEEAIGRQLEQLEAAILQVESGYAAAEQPVSAPEAPVEPIAAETVPDPTPVSTAPPAPVVVPEDFIDEPILIDGIGEKTAESLAAEGVTKISQIAAMSDTQLAAVTEAIGSPGFEVTQEWKQQSLDMLSGQLPRGKTNQDRLAKYEEARDASLTSPDASPAEAAAPSVPVSETVDEPVVDPLTPTAPEEAKLPDTTGEPVSENADNSPAQEEQDEDYKAFLDAFTKTSPAPAEPEQAAPVAPAPVEVPQEPPVAPVEVKPVPIEPVEASAVPVMPTQNATGPAIEEPVAPVVRDVPPPVAPSPAPAPAATEKQVVAPAPAQTKQTNSPAFVSELENDFARPEARAPQRSHPALKQKKGTGGKIVTGSLWVLLLGGMAAGGYYFREPLMEMSQKGITATRELLNVAEPEQQPVETETSPEPETNGDASKDNSRLGNGETAPDPSPVPVETVEPKPEAPEETSEAETQTQPVRSVDPEPATVEVEGEPEEEAANGETESQGETSANNESTQADNSAASTESAVLSGEQSYLYEEALGATGASRDEGNITWSLVDEPPEDGAEPEPVIKGVLEIPSRGLTLNISIKRNVDASLSASHLIELLFTPLGEFSGGNIDNISRFVMKANEQARGESLVGIPVRIDVGYFWIALNNLDQAQKTNLNLLESGEWVDLPVTYVTGRRALITFEKGVTGKDVFAKAFADWKNR